MITLSDARGVQVSLAEPPRRVVSLVPSTTETLFALGCGERVVGVTRFCVHPAQVKALPKVGGTKDLDLDRLRALGPDLVLGNAEENTREIFAAVEGAGVPLFVAFPRGVDAALADIGDLGRLLGVEAAASDLCREISHARSALPRAPFRYAYLIWRRPWMAVSDDTFIAALLAEAGGVNALGAREERYFELKPEELAEADPDAVLLSSEPFPFADKHRVELAEASGLPIDRFHLVDGEHCSWHGARLAASFRYLAGLGLGRSAES